MSLLRPTYRNFRCYDAFMFDLPSEFTYMPVRIYAKRQISERVSVREEVDLSKVEVIR